VKNFKMKQIILIAAFTLVSTSALSAPELKGTPEELRGFLHPADKVVSIHALAEEKAYSDIAIVSLVVTTEDKLLSDAISKNTILRAKITQSLVASGIHENLIKSSKFSSSPQYGWFGSKPSSFKIVNRMAISITDETHLKEIAVISDQYQEVDFSDTEFEHSAKDEYKQKVKAKAIDKILKQKIFYEKSLGLKLTAIGIRVSHIRQIATRGARVLEGAVISNRKHESDSFTSIAKFKEQAPSTSFDEVKYEADITVDFKIED
jgi:uncharacterized protein